MKTLSLALSVLLAGPALAATTAESARTRAQEAFTAAAATSLRPLFIQLNKDRRLQEEPQTPDEPILQDPKPRPVGPLEVPGAQVGKVLLAAQLDFHRDLLNRQLGALTWNFSVAGDAAFKNYFLTFAREAALTIAPLGDLNRLRGEGIDVTVAPGVVYNFKVSINIFNPVRGSTLELKPVKGTRGPKHDIKTGVILDAVKAKSYIFKSRGVEYWLLYGTDVAASGDRLADTRSFLIIHEAGTSSKAWPLAEAALPAGAPTAVTLGDARLILTRTAEAVLLINEPR